MSPLRSTIAIYLALALGLILGVAVDGRASSSFGRATLEREHDGRASVAVFRLWPSAGASSGRQQAVLRTCEPPRGDIATQSGAHGGAAKAARSQGLRRAGAAFPYEA